MNKVVNAFVNPALLTPSAHPPRTGLAFPAPLLLPISVVSADTDMPISCQIAGCKNTTPHALEEQKLCVLHYTLSLEGSCSEMRRETALGNTPHERQREIMRFITESGERLARVEIGRAHV